MFRGTRGVDFYPEYFTPVNYYEEVDVLFNPEIRDCFKLVFIEEGNGTLLINQKKIIIIPCTILCLNEEDEVTNIDFKSNKITIICFLPSAINNRLTIENIKINEGLPLSDSQDRLFLLPFIVHNERYIEFKYIDLESTLRIKNLLACLYDNLVVQNISWPCLARSYLMELLFMVEGVYRNNKENIKNAYKTFSIDEVIHYLHNNYWNKITLDDLAKKFNTNRTTLAKSFKNETGQTIINYLIKIRIHIAAGMLRDTYLTVDAIIDRVGFSNVTHFNKVFKEYNECLPKEYRDKLKPYSS